MLPAQDAVEVFKKLGDRADEAAYSLLCKAHSQTKAYSEAHEVITAMIKKGISPKLRTVSPLLVPV